MARKVEVEIVGDASSLSRAFKTAGHEAKGLGGHLGTLAKGAGLVAGGAALGGLFAVVHEGIGEFTEATKVTAQTNAVLKSTGGVAGVSAKQVDKLASSIMNKSGMDDEAVKSGENMLLTFTNIRNEAGKGNDIFNQTTGIMADLSTAMGIDTKQAALQLGKALNDPATGMTKLQRIGVTFTDSQKEAAKAMVAAGDTAGAQKIILGELTKEFGGSAEAAGKTLPGQLNILKQTFSNLAGEIIQKMMPAVQSFVGWIQEHWPQIEAVIKGVFDGIGWAWTNVLSPVLHALVDAGKAVVGWFRDHWPEIKDTVMAVVQPIVDWFQAHWPQIASITSNVFGTVKSIIVTTIGVIQTLWQKFGDNIMTAVRIAWDFVKNTIKNAMDVIRGIVNVVGGLIHGDWSRVWEGIKQVFAGQVKQIGNLFSAMARGLLDAGSALLNAAKGQWVNIGLAMTGPFGLTVVAIRATWGQITAAFAAGVNAVKSFLREHWVDIASLMTGPLAPALIAVKHFSGDIADAFRALWDKVKTITGNAAGAVGKAFGNVGDAIAGAVRGAWDAVRDAFSWLKDKIIGWLRKAFDWFSPSGVFEELGTDMMKGLAKGIVKKATDPLGAIKMLFKLMGKEFPGLDWLKNVAGKAFGLVKQGAKFATSGLPPGELVNKAMKGAWGKEKAVAQSAMDIANQNWPYAVGGGRPGPGPSYGAPSWSLLGAKPVLGYDCSGAVSAIMRAGGYMDHTESSEYFQSWGHSGPGRFISTISYGHSGGDGHVYSIINPFGNWGTGANSNFAGGGHGGPGWGGSNSPGVVRHPFGSQGAGRSTAGAGGNSGALGALNMGTNGGGGVRNRYGFGPDAFNGNYLQNAARHLGSNAGVMGNALVIGPNAGALFHGHGLQGFATGTRRAPGGLAWVGERGRELMYVPRGASVTPHGASNAITADGWPERIQLLLDRQVVAEVTRRELQTMARRNGTAGIR